MIPKEAEFPPLGPIIVLGEDFRCFGNKSEGVGNLARSGFYVRTPFVLENFSDGETCFSWENLRIIRKNPQFLPCPKRSSVTGKRRQRRKKFWSV